MNEFDKIMAVAVSLSIIAGAVAAELPPVQTLGALFTVAAGAIMFAATTQYTTD